MAATNLEAREWQLKSGATLDGDFYYRDSQNVWFKDHDGKISVVESTALPEDALAFIERLEDYFTDLDFEPWPRQ
ncbi:MAG: hypothetical protein AAF329_16460, partial [Cyanobacteria bacterium P01_A01_bin.17]